VAGSVCCINRSLAAAPCPYTNSVCRMDPQACDRRFYTEHTLHDLASGNTYALPAAATAVMTVMCNGKVAALSARQEPPHSMCTPLLPQVSNMLKAMHMPAGVTFLGTSATHAWPCTAGCTSQGCVLAARWVVHPPGKGPVCAEVAGAPPSPAAALAPSSQDHAAATGPALPAVPLVDAAASDAIGAGLAREGAVEAAGGAAHDALATTLQPHGDEAGGGATTALAAAAAIGAAGAASCAGPARQALAVPLAVPQALAVLYFTLLYHSLCLMQLLPAGQL
jgi:hypothetical protein